MSPLPPPPPPGTPSIVEHVFFGGHRQPPVPRLTAAAPAPDANPTLPPLARAPACPSEARAPRWTCTVRGRAASMLVAAAPGALETLGDALAGGGCSQVGALARAWLCGSLVVPAGLHDALATGACTPDCGRDAPVARCPLASLAAPAAAPSAGAPCMTAENLEPRMAMTYGYGVMSNSCHTPTGSCTLLCCGL